MSALIRISFLLLFLMGCQSETAVTNQGQGKGQYFSPSEVVAGLNALTAIIDWPTETDAHQKNLLVSPEEAKKLILPLHPLWDEKVEEVAQEIPKWDVSKIQGLQKDCAKNCECDFYQEVLDRHPEILEISRPELKSFAGLKFSKTKTDILNCLSQMPSIQSLLKFLREEQKNFESESIY